MLEGSILLLSNSKEPDSKGRVRGHCSLTGGMGRPQGRAYETQLQRITSILVQ